MAKAIQLARIGVSLDADTVNYINDLKKAQIETDKRLNAIDARYKRSGQSGKSLANASDQVTGSFKLQKNAASILGYQLQDIAVQAQLGTSAFVILAQQGSQLAAIFGPGGVMVGALLAIGGALVGSLVAGLSASQKEIESLLPSLESMRSNIAKIGEETARYLQLTLTEELKKQERQLDTLNAKLQAHSRLIGMQIASNRLNAKEQKAAEKTTQELRTQIEVLSEEVDKNFTLLQKAQDVIKGYNDSSLNAVGVARKLKEQYGEQREAVRQLAEGYAEEYVALVLTDKQLEIHRARVAGATEEEIKQISAIQDSIKALKDRQEAEKQLRNDKVNAEQLANSIINRGYSQSERLKAKEAELFRSKDLLSEQAYNQALQSIRNQQTAVELEQEEAERQRKDQLREQELNKLKEFERARRQLLTDTYNFEASQDLTKYERIQLENEREHELLNQKYADQRALHANNAEALALIDQQYQERQAQIDKKTSDAKIKATLGDLDTIAGAFGEQTKLAETFGKTQLVISQAIAFGKAYELGFPAYVPQLISLASSFAGLIGQFHGGTDSVPESMDNKSFLLKAGERVVQPEANKKLTSFLDSPAAEGSGGGITVEYKPQFNAPISNESWFKEQLSKNADQVGAIIQKQQRQYPNRGRR